MMACTCFPVYFACSDSPSAKLVRLPPGSITVRPPQHQQLETIRPLIAQLQHSVPPFVSLQPARGSAGSPASIRTVASTFLQLMLVVAESSDADVPLPPFFSSANQLFYCLLKAKIKCIDLSFLSLAGWMRENIERSLQSSCTQSPSSNLVQQDSSVMLIFCNG